MGEQMIDLAGVDAMIAGLSRYRDDLAQHADLVGKITKEKEDLASARAISFGLATTIKRKEAELEAIEKKIAGANTELKGIKEQIADRNSYKQTIQSEINGMRERLGL